MPAQGVHEKNNLGRRKKAHLGHAPHAVRRNMSCDKQGARLPIGTAHSTAKTGDTEQDPVPSCPAASLQCCCHFGWTDRQAERLAGLDCRAGWMETDDHSRLVDSCVVPGPCFTSHLSWARPWTSSVADIFFPPLMLDRTAGSSHHPSRNLMFLSRHRQLPGLVASRPAVGAPDNQRA